MKKSARPMSHHFTTVTTLSKTIAFILFIGLPFLAFFLGVKYGEVRGQIDMIQNQVESQLAQPTPSQPHQLYMQGITPTQSQMGY